MPVATGRVSWRSGTSNKTFVALLNAIRTFLVNSGNYTLITDQITASNYFVVQSTRNTGFTGDRIIAQVSIFNASGINTRPYLFIRPYESWSGTTGTNLGSGTDYGTFFSLTEDTDIWISCDTTFLLAMSRIRANIGFNNSSWITVLPSDFPPMGVVAIERLSGDSDPGTFYGYVGYEAWRGYEASVSTTRRIYVPKRFDGATGTSAFFNINTILGSSVVRPGIGLSGLDESGSHLALSIEVNLASLSKIKGRLLGVKVITTGLSLGYGDLIPNATSPQYIVGRRSWYRSIPEDGMTSGINILMEVAPTITIITT